jgi:hypothetical protein
MGILKGVARFSFLGVLPMVARFKTVGVFLFVARFGTMGVLPCVARLELMGVFFLLAQKLAWLYYLVGILQRILHTQLLKALSPHDARSTSAAMEFSCPIAGPG